MNESLIPWVVLLLVQFCLLFAIIQDGHKKLLDYRLYTIAVTCFEVIKVIHKIASILGK